MSVPVPTPAAAKRVHLGSAAGLIVEALLGRLGFSVISFTLAFYAVSLGMSLSAVGLLTGMRVLVALLAKPAMGWIADRVGHKPVFVASIAGRAVVALLFTLATEPVGLFLVRALHGLTTAARDPTATLLLVEHAGEGRVGRLVAWHATARLVGATLGFPTAGFLLWLSADDYRLVFLFAAGVSLVALVVAQLLVAPEAQASSPGTGSEVGEASAGGRGDWLPYAAVAAMVALPASMVGGMLFPLVVTSRTGLGKAEIGLVHGLAVVAVVLAAPALGWMTDTLSRRLVLSVRSGAIAFSSLQYCLATGFAGIAVARAADEVGKAAFKPAWGAVLADLARAEPAGRRGRLIARIDMGESLGEALGPVLAGLLWEHGGLAWLLVARLVLALVGEVVTWRVVDARR